MEIIHNGRISSPLASGDSNNHFSGKYDSSKNINMIIYIFDQKAHSFKYTFTSIISSTTSLIYLNNFHSILSVSHFVTGCDGNILQIREFGKCLEKSHLEILIPHIPSTLIKYHTCTSPLHFLNLIEAVTGTTI
jgi:hypothetical protein